MGFCIGMERVCFVVTFPLFFSFSVSLILSLSLCVHIETSILETGEWERQRENLVVCLSPPHHGAPETKQARRVHIHTHTFTRRWGEQLGSVLHWKPHFPSVRQTGRQLGVTLNPLPHVFLLTLALLFLSLLCVCSFLYLMARALKQKKRVSPGKK